MLSTQNRIQLIQLMKAEMHWSCLEVKVIQMIQKEKLWNFLEKQAEMGTMGKANSNKITTVMTLTKGTKREKENVKIKQVSTKFVSNLTQIMVKN